jgi:hypothetical protein
MDIKIFPTFSPSSKELSFWPNRSNQTHTRLQQHEITKCWTPQCSDLRQVVSPLQRPSVASATSCSPHIELGCLRSLLPLVRTDPVAARTSKHVHLWGVPVRYSALLTGRPSKRRRVHGTCNTLHRSKQELIAREKVPVIQQYRSMRRN